jgi:hypothetical protein
MTPNVLDTIDAELACVLRPLAKATPRLPHADENEPARERFVKSIDALGWSWDRIARFLDCAKTSVIAVYKGHRYVPARWLDKLDTVPEIKAMPTLLRAAQLRKVG